MKAIRIWFKKTGTAKYISHLDLCRCMERAIHKAKLPFWYTEGFNPHVFLTINMPISLGYSGLRESMDVRLLEDHFLSEQIVSGLNGGLPPDIRVTAVTAPVMKPGDLSFSSYEIYLNNQPGLLSAAEMMLAQEEIIVRKRGKKGDKDVDIKPDFADMACSCTKDGHLCFAVTLKSSSNGSINPRLFFDALSAKYGENLYPETIRTNCFNEEMHEFL